MISVGEKYTSGINTNSKVYIDDIIRESNRIIIWGGAERKDDNTWDIAKAPFRLTLGGDLYVKSAHIENSVIAGSEIRTPKIIGTGEGPALTITDARIGIQFKNEDENKKYFEVRDKNTNIYNTLSLYGDKEQSIDFVRVEDGYNLYI
jgi:hypothetical protein